LTDAKGFASFGEIQQFLLEKHQVALSYSRVHTIVRYEMKAKLKAPRANNPNKNLCRAGLLFYSNHILTTAGWENRLKKT